MKNKEILDTIKNVLKEITNYHCPIDDGELTFIFPLELRKHQDELVEYAKNHYVGMNVNLIFTDYYGKKKYVKRIEMR